MSELRQDRTSGAWVIVAPERRLRPRQGAERGGTRPNRKSFDPECPFCPGAEARLPGIIDEVPCETAPGWQLRVVPNKFPALRPDAAPLPARHDGRTLPGYGYHEVVIESARHDVELSGMSDHEIGIVTAAYKRRFAELARPRIECIVLFRNQGASSGASLVHPHAQLLALAVTPPEIRARLAWAEAWHRDHGRCVLCDEMEIERGSRTRLIRETEHFVATVPFAASSPCEMWVTPRRHHASFAGASDAEMREIGPLLRDLLIRLKLAHGTLPFQLVLDSVLPGQNLLPDQHWRLRIVPVLTVPGGFERASGMPINPSLPEDDAERLRTVGPAPTIRAEDGSAPGPIRL
ncbi:galactose-1-phosphate uridylyltransferase [Desertibaculum subflavum]|uniref:galactose-1-phosphate uridylyltransferase n=1 Tax=Desertibaculum subflavum TaxID=2268458 RepID=UPI000E6713F9